MFHHPIINLPVGYLYLVYNTFRVKASPSVRKPIRPTNIDTINISLPATDKCGVIPNESPTVPKAETISKKSSFIEKPGSAMIIKKENKRINDEAENNTAYEIGRAHV